MDISWFDNTDNSIIKNIYDSKRRVRSNLIKEIEKHLELKRYLENRFNDIPEGMFSYKEVIWRIANKIEKRPVCKLCGSPVLFVGSKVLDKKGATENGYRSHCCSWCLKNDQRHKEKVKASMNERYGVDGFTQSDSFKRLFENEEYRRCIVSKRNASMKANGYSKISKYERHFYSVLLSIWKDVKVQYSDDRYPFKADFYIPSEDLFIEYNGSQFHHFHPYNDHSEEDQREVARLKEKAKEATRYQKKSQYDTILYVWTDLDPRKRMCASSNHLKHIELWNSDDRENLALINTYIDSHKSEM